MKKAIIRDSEILALLHKLLAKLGPGAKRAEIDVEYDDGKRKRRIKVEASS